MKLFKKSISLLLSAVIIFSLFTIVPFEASAATASDWSSIKSLLELSSQNSITLEADVKAGESDACLTIESGKNFTIDLNGHTLSGGRISADDKGYVIVVKNGGTLTIMDSSGDNSGKITGGYSKNGGAVYNEGTLTIEGGTITENIASEKGGAIYNKGTLTVSGGSITNNMSEDGGGIYNDSDGTATVCGTAEISANKTTENGGGITNLGTLTVSDNTSISCNYGYSNGGGIWNGGTATVTGGSITGNSATKAGSGVFDQGTLNMQGDPVVKDNIGDDVYLPSEKTITVTGRMDSTARIGVSSSAEKAVVTSGYGSHNSSQASDYFFENGADSLSVVDTDGEVKLNTDGIAYVDRAWDAENFSVTKEIKHLTGYITASGSLSGLSGNNWYVVKGNVTVDSRIDNRGKANILLCDGASIEFKEGIRNQSNMGSELNIYAQQTGTGKLTATGTYDVAAIGSEDEEKSGTINIYGGVISTVYGIGGAYECAGGIVRIYSAEVKSREIGCGTLSEDDTSAYIGIYNSSITASIHNGAGVLDFYNSSLNNYGVLTFSEAEVGAHNGCKKMGDINIVNSYIDASTKIGQGAAIGSCEGCDAGNIRIINSTVNAHSVKDSVYGYGYGAAIGGGKGGKGGNIVIDHSCVVASAYSGAAIGGGKGCSGGSVSITDSVVMTSAYMGGAGIGGGDDGHGGAITITRSHIFSQTESSKEDLSIGYNYSKAAYSIAFEMMQRMTNGFEGNGSQIAYFNAGYVVAYFISLIFSSTHGGAAIGGGDCGDSGTINITESEVTAIGGEYTAGIGGGDEGGCNNITITNSTVDATGGNYAAGIGSGDEADKMETITITGSTVKASSKKEGAGIGGGNDTSSNEIIITESNVTATGGEYAAGIGGGDDGNGGTIDISGSTVTSTAGKDGAGIGGGEGGDGGTVKIRNSNVKATGKNYGAGIGCGEDGDSSTVEIYGSSTVEATAGDSGYSTAIGKGDYTFISPDLSAYFDKGLAVKAGSSSSDTEIFNGQERYKAVWNSKYAKIYPCEHQHTEWRYENSSYHRRYCIDCGTFFGDYEDHKYDSDNICDVCGCSAVMATLTLAEKNCAGDEVTTVIEAPKYTEYTLPECTNVPDGMAFIGWQLEGEECYYEPGETLQVTNDTVVAIYLPVVTAQFIDSEGSPGTVQARQLSDDIVFLSAGWYVADSDLDYSRLCERTIIAAGDVRIILADGVTVYMGDSTGNSSARAIQAKNRLSTLSIYGQTEQSGTIRCDNNRIDLANFNMVGGSLRSTGNVAAAIETNFVRGTLECVNFNSANGFAFSGGNLTADRFMTNTDNLFGWTNLSDSIRFSEINTLRKGTVTVADGQAFTDGENIYTGTLTPEQVNAIQGKTLTPYQLHHFGDPEWTWSDDHHHAAALFKCTDDDCDYQTEVDAVITSEEMADRVVYTATAEFNGETYNDEKVSYSDSFGAALSGHSVSLDGDIGVNFYMELDDKIANSQTAYMQFTVPTVSAPDIQTVFVRDVESTLLNGKQYYVFKCHVAAKEMTSDISAQMFDADRASREYSYSVKEYGDWLLAHADLPEFAGAAPLVKAMLNYGAYAQSYFDINPGTLANDNLEETEKELGEVQFTAPDTAFSLPEVVTFEGATLSLKSETTLSLYFKSDETLEFGIEGKKVETVINGTYQVARICGITASELQDSFTLTVTAGESSGTVKYSPMNYCHNALNGGTTNDKLINAVKALYRYARAAKEYFNPNQEGN